MRARRYPGPGGVSPGGVAPLVLSVSIAAALGRLVAPTSAVRVLVPLAVAIVIADAVTALVVRLGVRAVLAAAGGWGVAVVGLIACIDPTLFDPWSHHFLHGALLSHQLREAHGALANGGTPLPLLSGVVIAIGALGAVAAALTRAIWSRHWRGAPDAAGHGTLAQSLAPSLALFVYSTLVSAEQERVAAVVSYLVGVLLFVVLADRAAAAQAIASVQPLRRRGPLVGAVAACLLTSLVVIGTGAGLSGMQLTVFHARPQSAGGNGPAQSLLTGLALVDSLRTTELSQSDVVVFRARSAVTTYWQVGILSSFNGTAWLPTAAVGAALLGVVNGAATAGAPSPADLPAPAPAQTFSAEVAISDFVSRLLPAPPGTFAVEGLRGPATVAAQGVLAAAPSAPGTDYSVTAPLQATVPTNGPQLAATDPRLAPYLALPAQPAIVGELARQAVGAARTPEAEAQALVDWFRSGRFRYTLSPPATHGPDPLVQFLTVTRAGFCQQFAGAYGVLARALGIPTRLAVGFTPGQPGPGGTFTVTGADAHVWPQVYLGPAAGWVSVEPTPPAGSTAPAAGVLGPSQSGVAPPGGTHTTTQTTTPSTVPSTAPSGTGPAGAHSSGPAHHSRPAVPGRHGTPYWILAVVLAGLLVLVALVVGVWRRRLSALEALLPEDLRVVRAWERATDGLRRRGMPRRIDETPAEYAARIAAAEKGAARSMEADALAHLAALVEMACYTPRPSTPGQADRAQDLAAAIVTANRPHDRRRDRRHAGRMRHARRS